MHNTIENNGKKKKKKKMSFNRYSTIYGEYICMTFKCK